MKRVLLIVLSFFFLATPALAGNGKADRWIVSQLSGDARVVHRGVQPASLKVNSALAPGDVVITGASGRATLTRGADYIMVAPRSELRLPAQAQPSGFTRVIQTLGTMLFKVKHTGVPHFAVDTPMLAAVVKGTTFTIIVDRDRSAVQVIEGAVEVTATEGGMQRLVKGGTTVFIDRDNPKLLITADAHTLGASDSETSVKLPGSGDESLAEVVGLTNGLVQAEPVALATNSVSAIVGALIAPTAVADSGTPVAPGTPETTTEILAPITEPIEKVLPIVEPVVDPVLDPIVEPIVEVLPDVEPIVEALPDVEPILEPVIEPIVEALPEVEPVVEPIVEALPEVEPVVEPIVEALPDVEPVVEPIVEALPDLEPVTEPIVEALPEIPDLPGGL